MNYSTINVRNGLKKEKKRKEEEKVKRTETLPNNKGNSADRILRLSNL